MARNETALEAIKAYLEWGAKTSSDNELFEERFFDILIGAGVEVKLPPEFAYLKRKLNGSTSQSL